MKKLFFILFVFSFTVSFGQTKNNNPNVYNINLFGGKGDGTYLYDVSTTNTSATITSASASFKTADIGKTILVNGAGAAGAVLRTTIASITNSTTAVLTATASATLSSDTLIYGSDNTAALQAAINACANARGGKVHVPVGIYLFSSALSGSGNTQVSIPINSGGTSNVKVFISIEGETVYGGSPSGYLVSTTGVTQTKGVIFYSTISGSGTIPSFIGSADQSTRNRNDFSMSNVGIFVYSNHGASAISMTAINGTMFQKINVKQCSISPDIEVNRTTSPASSEVAGIIAGSINDNGENMISENQVVGFKYGIICGEHTRLDGNLIFANLNGIVLPLSSHAITGHSQVFVCANEVYSPFVNIMGQTSGPSNVDLIIESEWDTTAALIGTKWYKSINNVSDSGNRISGKIRINLVANGANANTGGAHVYGTDATQLSVTTFSQVPFAGTGSNTQIPVLSSATAFTATSALTFDANKTLNIGSSTAGGIFVNPAATVRDGWYQGVEIQANATNSFPALIFSNQTDGSRYGAILATRSTSGSTSTSQQSLIDFPEQSNVGTIEFRANGNIGTTNPTKMMMIYGNTGVSIGNAGFTPTSTLHDGGSFAGAYLGKGTSYTLTSTDYVVEATVTGNTYTLPTAAGITGRIYTIKLTASGSATIATTSSQTIDASTTYSLSAQYKYVTVMSNGSNWIIIANN